MIFLGRNVDLSAKPVPAAALNARPAAGEVWGFSRGARAVGRARIARPRARPRGRRRDHAFAGAIARRPAPLRGRAPALLLPARGTDARATPGARPSAELPGRQEGTP